MPYFTRIIEQDVIKTLKSVPVTAITGPRQCGKSTLIKNIIKQFPKSVYLDLERPDDLKKLDDAQWFFTANEDNLICIDEIQRKPELFPLIRSLTDEWDRNGCFFVSGSASRDMLRQSSETLAGRISYKFLSPFLFEEINSQKNIEQYMQLGGFPRSVLAQDEDISYRWRQDFITTFLERDLLQWAGFTPATMRRLWQMLAHINGQTVNYSALSASLSVTSATVKNYIDLLASTYMVDVVPPYFSNLKKRLIKAPKIYVADSGVTAALLGIHSFNELSAHPAFGFVWEQIVLSHLKVWYPNADIFFYRTSNGAEIDFVLLIDGKIFAVECKASYAPELSKGNYFALEDIAPQKTFVVIPSQKSWPMKDGIEVVSLSALKQKLSEETAQRAKQFGQSANV
jgi:predicted AAA+ superfamily ATPase